MEQHFTIVACAFVRVSLDRRRNLVAAKVKVSSPAFQKQKCQNETFLRLCNNLAHVSNAEVTTDATKFMSSQSHSLVANGLLRVLVECEN